MGSILSKETAERQSEFKKTLHTLEWVYLDYFHLLFSYVAKHMPLNSLFFDEDSQKIIGDIVADIIRDSNLGNAFLPETRRVDDRLQTYLSEMCVWGAGRCYNYAALALFHLLEEGVRPIDALWVSDSSPASSDASGHQIIVIGLPSNQDYTKIATSEALVLDFWAGKIVPASHYFATGSQFHGFDASVVQCCRVNEGETNPFVMPCLIETEEVREFKQSTANKIMSIINERKNAGEIIHEFNLTQALIAESSQDGANILDVEFRHRTSEIKKNLSRLGLFEQSAKKIQHKFRQTHPASNTTEDESNLSEATKFSKK